VSRLVDFTLETTKGGFNGLSLSNIDLDGNGKLGGAGDCRGKKENVS